MLTARTSHAARALLGWSQEDLAKAAGLTRLTILFFEQESRKPKPQTLAAIERAIEDAGVTLLDGGAQLTERKARVA